MNCVETLGKLKTSKPMHEIFLNDTKAAYAKMVATEEVRRSPLLNLRARQTDLNSTLQLKAQEKREREMKKTTIQPDDVISFRQFAKKATTDETIDVSVVYKLRQAKRAETEADEKSTVDGP